MTQRIPLLPLCVLSIPLAACGGSGGRLAGLVPSGQTQLGTVDAS